MSVGSRNFSRSETSFSNSTKMRETNYLVDNLGEALKSALTEIQIFRPKDPIDYLAKYLYKFVDNTKHKEQLKIDAIKLQNEIKDHEEEIKRSKEREEERRVIQEEELRMKIQMEAEKKQKEEEDKFRKEEEMKLAEQEARDALLLESKVEGIVEEDKDAAETKDIEDTGKLPPVVEADEIEDSIREDTKVDGGDQEDVTARDNADPDIENGNNNEDENIDDQTIVEDPDE